MTEHREAAMVAKDQIQKSAQATDRGAEVTYALEPHYYTDPAIFEREKERVFFRTWQYAGHVSLLQKTGDYFVFNLLDQSLFCVRDGAGAVRVLDEFVENFG